MAFGKATGPPASHHQMKELIALLERAGHTDFRDARGPMGFTQRQAGGKFTRDEAQRFIEQLEEAEAAAAEAAKPTGLSLVRSKPAAADPELADVSTERLAAELERRGWTAVER